MEVQTTAVDMIIAGDDGDIPNLWVFPIQQVTAVSGILDGTEGVVLHNDLAGIHTLLDEPFGHLSGFSQFLVVGSGAAAGAHDVRIGIFQGRSQCYLQTVIELIPHGTVGL